MKNVNGIQTPFDNAIMSPPSGSGVGAKDVGGVDLKDGQKGVGGELAGVNGVSLRDDSAPGIGGRGGIQ